MQKYIQDRLLRKKLLVTGLVLVLFRFGCFLTLPFVDASVLQEALSSNALLSLNNLVSGSAFEEASFLAIGVIVYIQTGWILFVGVMIFDKLKKARDNHTLGYRYIERFVRLLLSAIMACGTYATLRAYGVVRYCSGGQGIFAAMVMIVALIAGAQITVLLIRIIGLNGIGNGASLMIFMGIVSQRDTAGDYLNRFISAIHTQDIQMICCLLAGVAITIASIMIVVFISNAEVRIPARYTRNSAKNIQSYIPLRFVTNGVMAIMYASMANSYLWQLVLMIWNALPRTQATPRLLTLGVAGQGWLYVACFGLLIALFQLMFAALNTDETSISNFLRLNKCVLLEMRAGEETITFLVWKIRFCALLGAMVLTGIIALPIVFFDITGVSLLIDGTSLLLLCGIATNTAQQLKSYVLVCAQNDRFMIGTTKLWTVRRTEREAINVFV